MAPPKSRGGAPPKGSSKKLRVDASSSSNPTQPLQGTIPGSLPIFPPENWVIVPQNRFLFKDDEAYRYYTGNIVGNSRSIAECYYLLQPKENQKGWRIAEMDWDYIKPHLDYLGAWGLFHCTQPYNKELVKLFYANLDVTWEDGIAVAHSYVCGKPITITTHQLCTEFFIKNEGKQVYVHKSWPRDADIEPFEKYHEFFYVWRDFLLKQFTATELPAYHRLFFLIINNILAPKRQIKTNVELREVFYLRCILEKNPPVNLAYLFFMHLDKAKNTSNMSFPYANVISYFIAKEGISPRTKCFNTDSTFYVMEPTNLIDALPTIGWVLDDKTEILTPDPNFVRNRYLHQPGAKVNQYAPVGQEPTGSLRGPNVSQQELDPAVQAYMAQHFGAWNTTLTDYGTRLTNLENDWTQWKASDTRWKEEDAKWKSDFQTHHDTKINKIETDVQNFWGSMQNEFKKLHIAIKKGSSSGAGGGDDDSDED